MFSCIVDDEITLRLIEKEDALLLAQRVHENASYLKPYMQWIHEDYSIADAEMFIALVRSYFAEETFLPLTIWYQGRLVGMVSAKEIHPVHRSAELGYWIERPAQGKGIMTRALKRVLRELFDNRRLNRVSIRCAAHNDKSRSVAERLGFSLEGVMRQDVSLQGHPTDTALYSMLHSEWKANS